MNLAPGEARADLQDAASASRNAVAPEVDGSRHAEAADAIDQILAGGNAIRFP